MTNPQLLGLTDRQLELVHRAARALPIERRDAFLLALAKRLAPSPSDYAVAAAVIRELDIVPVFFSSAPSKEQTND